MKRSCDAVLAACHLFCQKGLADVAVDAAAVDVSGCACARSQSGGALRPAQRATAACQADSDPRALYLP